MKKLIQNLFMPFAVVAMLSVGAFTVNASEKTGNAVEIEKMETIAEPKSQSSYDGDVFIRKKDPITNNYVYTMVINTSETDCGLEVSLNRCITEVEGKDQELWGKDLHDNYIPLYKFEN